MKKFYLVLFVLLLLFPLAFSFNLGIGASPTVFNVTIGNESGSNHIIYLITIYNTGDVNTKVRMIPDKNMLNFSQPVQNNIIVEVNKTKEFLIKFDRNGTENKNVSGKIRMIAEPEDKIQSGMITTRPAVDLKINIFQLPMEAKLKPTVGETILVSLLGFIILIFIATL
jgi:hypothetical protein